MSIYATPLEGTNGATVTTTNHGGTTLDTVAGTLVYTNTRASHGSTGVVATATGRLAYNLAPGTTKAKIRAYLNSARAVTSGDFIVGFFYVPGSGLKAAQLIINSANKFRIQTWDEAGVLTARWSGASNGTGQTSSTITAPVNDSFRCELYADITAGEVWAAVFDGDSTTPLETSGTITGLDLRGTELTSGNLAVTIPGTVSDVAVDDFAVYDGSDATKTANPVGNTAPSVTMPAPANVTAGQTVTLTAIPTDPDGTVASRVWTVLSSTGTTPALTNATTDTVSFTAPPAGTILRLQYAATDNGGATGTGTVEVRVLVPGGTNYRPAAQNAVATVGTWSIVGGSANDGAALADDNASTLLRATGLSGTAVSKEFRWQPSAARTGPAFSLQHRVTAGTGTAVVRALGANSRPLQVWTTALTTTATFYTYTLDAAVVATLTAEDWADGRFKVEVTA